MNDSNQNEKIRILNMVKEGKITVEDAQALLDALNKQDETERVVIKDTRGRKPKKLKILVDANDNSDKARVNVNIPISLVKSLGPVMIKSIPESAKDKIRQSGVDLEQIIMDIDSILEGNVDEDIVNIDAGEEGGEGAKVRIYFE